MGSHLELVTASPEDTREVGRAVGSLLRAGDVVALTGDLGAGKTTFVQGAARALDVTGPVLSPTFTLVREYAGSTTVYHLDVYRLDRVQDVLDLGFEEMLDEGGIVFVEWGDAIDPLLPESHLQVELSLPEGREAPDGSGQRHRGLVAAGRAWADRWERLGRLTERWRG